jgi:DNA-binding CsgD family transcriptional regulator/tetratricopeptide (TPR) repeat protein
VPPEERFLGRVDDLAELEDAWAAAIRGHPQLVLVTGDAGIGKSALVAHFAEGRPGARLLRGGCFGLVSAELPYSPVVQALRPLGAEGSTQISTVDGATLCAALGGSVSAVGEATRWAQSRLFESALRLFGDLARERPVLLALEDLHWADQATLDLLLFVVGNLVSERVLILLTAREDEPDAAPWLDECLQRLTRNDRSRVLELGPLDDEESARLAADAAGTDPDAVREIVQRAGGNPLFLIELARTRRREGLPRRLRDLLLLRLHRLPADARRVVEVLSTSTAPISPQRLVRALEKDVADPRAAVAEAFDAHLLITDRTAVGLRHPLLGDAVYAALPPTDRAYWHERLAVTLAEEDADGLAAVLAYHWERAGRTEMVPAPLVRAARSAAACFAYAEAVRGWERLLDLEREVPAAVAATGLDRPGILVELARAQRWAPTPERGIEALREAVARLGDDALRGALAREQLARQCIDCGRLEEAIALAAEAERMARTAPARVRGRVAGTHAAALMIRGDYAASRERCRAALDITADAEDAVWERAHALSVLAVDLVNLGDVEGALAALADGRELPRALDDPEPLLRDYVNEVYVLEAAGRCADAVRAADEGLAYAERHSMQAVAGTLLLGNKASALIGAGDLLAARELLGSAVTGPGRSAWLQYARLRLAEVEVALGHADRAEQLISEAEAEDVTTDSLVETQFRLVHALLALARSRPERAEPPVSAELSRAEGGTEPVTGLHLYAVGLRALALVAARGGRPDDEIAGRAAAILAAAERLRDQAPLPPCQDLFALCSLEYRECRGESDPAGWAELAERLVAAGRAGLAPYCFYRAALGRLGAGDRAAAEAPLRSAWAHLAPLGDAPLRRDVEALATRCRVRLADPAASVPAPRPEPAPFGLTAREQDVLALLCAGATNRRIARDLVISERTVGVHVSHVLAKLSARNRAEAVTIAHRAGLVPTASSGPRST